jgi:aryl-alcohol dehydrogenase-like predicted oxidoreductase
MERRRLGRTDLFIAPLVLGGNVFGWTADEKTSFDLLDRFLDAGLNAVDTADSYSRWVPGHEGGESETIIGKWMKARRNRERIVLITKVGSDMGQGKRDLSASWIARASENSLRRLQTDRIDLYLSHWPDPTVPYEETLSAYRTLIEQGKVRHVGASNLDADQLSAALRVSAEKGLPRYEVLQPELNLYDREKFDGALSALCTREEIGVITYYGLAKGFLSGKYRSREDLGRSVRGGGIEGYLNERGLRILSALDAVSARHSAKPAEVALAWIIARPDVTAPIASATSLEQLESLVRAVSLRLTAELEDASRP